MPINSSPVLVLRIELQSRVGHYVDHASIAGYLNHWLKEHGGLAYWSINEGLQPVGNTDFLAINQRMDALQEQFDLLCVGLGKLAKRVQFLDGQHYDEWAAELSGDIERG